ncbi:MAG: ankyrin repeat domain-containing protein [Parachlamydiales bacterium]|nr:ankyrin repeat domain-containing protein [Parachlamydiales bacterium]
MAAAASVQLCGKDPALSFKFHVDDRLRSKVERYYQEAQKDEHFPLPLVIVALEYRDIEVIEYARKFDSKSENVSITQLLGLNVGYERFSSERVRDYLLSKATADDLNGNVIIQYGHKIPLLHLTALKGDEIALRLLLEKGADKNIKDPNTQKTTLEVVKDAIKAIEADKEIFLKNPKSISPPAKTPLYSYGYTGYIRQRELKEQEFIVKIERLARIAQILEE